MFPEEILKQLQTLSEYVGFNPYEEKLSEGILKDVENAKKNITSAIEKIKSSKFYRDKK